MKKRIISILHHSIKSPVKGKIAEELGWGWHFKTAKALAKYGGFQTIAMRPSGSGKLIVKYVYDVPVILAPTIRPLISNRLWKWKEISPMLAHITKELVSKYDYVPYIHEYRALNSELIMRKLANYPMILQHHGSIPIAGYLLSRDLLLSLKELSKARREKLFRRVKGAFFVLHEMEKNYLEDIIGVEAMVRIRPLAVDFDELKPPTSEEKFELRRKWSVPQNAITLISYVGVFKEKVSGIKGLHIIPRIWKFLRNAYSSQNTKVILIVTGIEDEDLRHRFILAGIRAYGYLPHKRFIELLKLSDVLLMIATPAYMYGIAGSVTFMEALALGIPIIGPALLFLPEKTSVKYLGIPTSFIDSNSALREFLNKLVYILNNIESFQRRRDIIRQTAHKYYSWEAFLRDFDETLRKIV